MGIKYMGIKEGMVQEHHFGYMEACMHTCLFTFLIHGKNLKTFVYFGVN